MDPLAELKIAALGALVRKIEEQGEITQFDLEIPFSELTNPPSVEVDADPSSKTLSVSLVEDEDA